MPIEKRVGGGGDIVQPPPPSKLSPQTGMVVLATVKRIAFTITGKIGEVPTEIMLVHNDKIVSHL